MKFISMLITCVILNFLLVDSVMSKPPAGKGPKTSDPGTVLDPQAKQTPPIQLGTSGGWEFDLANGYCCGGTLGSLVEDSAGQYILSNFHVLAADVVSGGNNLLVDIGSPVIQPGLIDVSCNHQNAQVVAYLEGWGDPLQGSNVDAAIAQVETGMVSSTGDILGIGTLSAETVPATIRQRVKKMGRTTGLSSSRVDGLNATIRVSYENECAGDNRGTATFTGQIVIANKGRKFLDSGDSGSLMVEDVDTNPRAVGLLFAGSSTVAIANPIDEVLTKFGVTMVGVSGAPASSSTVDPLQGGEMAAAAAVQRHNARYFESVPNAVGHAIGRDSRGRPVLKVYVEKDPAAARALLSPQAGGFPIVIEVTGKIVAF